MAMEMRAPCGIDCTTCSIYQAANDPAKAACLAEEWKKTWLPDVTPEWFVCQGCRADRSLCWSGDCSIHACCVEQKGLDLCSQCDEFPCAKIEEWGAKPAHHVAAFEWLKSMRKS